MGRLLRYLFWLVVVSWSVAILRNVVRKMVGGEMPAKPSVDGPNTAVNQKLVRDPICGMHVAEGLSLSLQQGGQVVHFCSTECRDKYLGETRRISASA